MRRKGNWGCAAICIGVMIILALVLPSDVLWFFFAVALIYMGLWYIRRC